MMGYKSNAAISKEAAQASTAADQASATAVDGNGSHSAASNAHDTASWKHKQAGNATKANKHAMQARVHGEKASREYQTQDFARSASAQADGMSKKADMAKHGQDPNDPRSEQELHDAAAEAHGHARDAAKLAKDDRAQKYHGAKQAFHASASADCGE